MVFESPAHDGRSATSVVIAFAAPAGEPSALTAIVCSTESMMNATVLPSGERTAAPSSRSDTCFGASATG